MQRQSTRPEPEPKPPIPFALVLVAVAALVGLMLLGAYALAGTGHGEPRGRIDADDGDPYFVTPVASPAAFRLEVSTPALSDEQAWYLRMVQALPRLPLAFGIDAPPIGFTDDEAAVFTALIISESMLRPFDDYGNALRSEIGCVGLSQLCGDLQTYETATNPAANVYAGAAYFKGLIDETGDVMVAVRRYKGITTEDTHEQGERVFRYLKVRS